MSQAGFSHFLENPASHSKPQTRVTRDHRLLSQTRDRSSGSSKQGCNRGRADQPGKRRRDTMRKLLLAGAAILGTAGGSWAQTYPRQGTRALPWTNFYGANSNINANGTAQPGGAKLPDPGTVVIHLNGRVWGDVDLSWSSL